MNNSLHTYLKNIAETQIRGDAREESYYPFLKSLIETSGSGQTAVTVLPKKTEAGNPDFRVWDGRQHITGYIEAKTPGTNLDQIENTEQLKRYLNVFPNLILTDFYEFRLYREGRLTLKTFIGRSFIASQVHHLPPLENIESFEHLISQFFSFSLPRAFTAEGLAVDLAKRTRFLRDEVIAEELKEEESGRGNIRGFYHVFQQYLIPDLSESDFADLYSQTLVYGMFAARSRSGAGEFNRTRAFQYIPPTIGILRDIFQFISLGDLPAQMEVIIDDIADVLAAADLDRILHEFDHAGRGRDPIVHFYETFLSAYDPRLREQRGVYYTPEPVVRYIVRSIHELLEDKFSLPDGIADSAVTLLDPAAGTLTFPAEAIRLAVSEHNRKYGSGDLHHFLKDQILKKFYAFELLMAPYAVGHLKMSFLLDELGCPLNNDDRFQLYLTNTLNMEDLYLSDVPGLSSLSEESHEAAKIKQDPILVILGNPPYSGMSANSNEWTEHLLKTDMDGAQSYYTVDNQPLKEKNPKWLQDDYVKFLRFAQWKVQRAGRGVVGMITNHGYLDNPTFRGMRQSLMKTFNEIYVLNLHGSALKKEKTPEGGKDENVFDIRPGVAVVLLVKQQGREGCTVKQADLYGTREQKYAWLDEHQFSSTDFQEVHPATPWYFFTQNGVDALLDYQNCPRIDQIFPRNSVGIVTSRDELVIDENKDDLRNRVNQLVYPNLPDNLLKTAYNIKENAHWSLEKARAGVRKPEEIEFSFTRILYRPFDSRWIFYHDAFLERPRREIMRHMLQGENLALITVRRIPSNKEAKYFFISNQIIVNGTIRSDNQSIDSIFPLYLYPSSPEGGLLGDSFSGRTPNLDPQLVARLTAAYGQKPSPEAVLYYIYGVFYSTLYRQKYSEALRIDFPRVPFTCNFDVFCQVAALGKRLVELHLLKSSELNPPLARYQGGGSDDTVEKVDYDPESGRVMINSSKYFEGIPAEVWQYQIGGYQVLSKYLKDRRGLPMNDPVRYVRIATALAKTIELQNEIDIIYPLVEENPLV